MIQSILVNLFLIIILILFAIGTLYAILIVGKNGNDPQGSHQGYSKLARLSSPCLGLWALLVIIYVFWIDLLKILVPFEIISNELSLIIGLMLMIIGLVFELFGIKTLGMNFRIDLPKENTELVRTGIYSFMRNPIVFGLFLLTGGTFLVVPGLPSFIILILNVITFNAKAKDEEKFLIDRFGEDFEKYAKEVGRYLPFSFRNKKDNLVD